MAVDRFGKDVLTGEVYLVAGVARRVDGDSVLVVQNPASDVATRVRAGDVVRLDDLHDAPLRLPCKNTTASTLTRGTPVYATGSVGSTSTIEIAASDASVPSSMLAVGLLEDDVAHNAFGHVVATGVVRQLNTGAFVVGQTLYVASGGGLTATRPTNTTHKVQALARVLRAHASTGVVLVLASAVQEFSIGSGLSLSGTLLTATGGGGGGGSGNAYFPSGW